MSNIYLQHHGIKGQKWGVRRFQNTDGSYTSAGKKRYNADEGGGISGAIRRKQRSNAERSLSEIRSKQKQVDEELNELKGYAKNPSKIGSSKVSTVIRNKQIKSLEKIKAQLKEQEGYEKDALKELDDIERYVKESGKKAATKIVDKAKDKVATKWAEESKARKEEIREKIRDALFPRMEDDVWNEKPGDYRNQPWDEKPHKKTGGNI